MKKFTLGIIVGLLIGLLTFASFAVADSPIKLIVNGAEVQTGDCPPQIVNGYTLVPARALAESLDCNVVWDEVNNAVIITSNVTTTEPTQTMPETVTESTTSTVNDGVVAPVTTVTNDDGSTTTTNSDGSVTTTSEYGTTTTTKHIVVGE